MIDSKEFLDLQNFIVNLKDYQDFKPSSLDIAKQYNLNHSMKNSINEPYSLCTSTKTFKHNGPAIYLYFVFLKKLCILFAVFSLMTFPSVLNNFYGDGLEYNSDQIQQNVEFKLTQFLMKFSVANQNQMKDNHWVGYFSWVMLIGNDFFISILFLVFLIYWAVELEHQTQVALTERGLPSYYTIIVENLPNNYSQSSMKQYFSDFGDVVEVSTVRKVSNVYKNVNKIQNLLDKLLKQKNNHKMYKIYVKLIDQYKDLRSIYRKLEQSKPLSAFVSFDQMRNRNYVLDLAETQNFIYLQSVLKIQKCNIQPANILWQNYHIDQKKHNKRSFLIWVLIVLIFIGGMTLLFFVRVNAKVGSGLQIEIKHIVENIDDLIELDDEKMTDSFCYNQGFKGFFQHEIHKLCLTFYAKYTKHLVLIFKGSSIIVALNFLLNIVFSYLTDYRRYATVTAKNVFLIISKSFTIFITNTLLMLLLQCQIGGLAPRQLFEWVFKIKRQHQLYKQFSRKWYLDIGAQIIMTYILSVVLFPIAYLILEFIKKIFRSLKARCKQRQGAMNKAYLDPEFDFNSQYCDIINAVFTCLTFSSGLPILYPLCCLALFIIYWCSKITLIKLSREPHPSDHTLNQIIARVLPASLFIHSFMSRYFFSSQELFPRPSKFPIISMGIIMLITAVFFKWRKNIMAALRRYRIKRNESLIFEQNKSLNKLLQTQKKFLYSYRMEDNPEYQNVFYAITLIDMFEKNKRVEMDGRAKSEYCIQNLKSELESEDIMNQELTNRRIKRAKQSII